MKKFLTLFTFSLLATIAFAQKLEVKYQEIVKVNPEEFKGTVKFSTNGKESTIPNDIFAELLKSVTEPKDYLLTIYDHQTTYKKVEKLNNQQGNNSFSYDDGGSAKNLLKNLSTKEYFRNANVMDKPYLIKDKLTEYKWQLSRKTKKIIGFDVKKATAIIDSTKSVVAWYAPSIAIKDGPAMYNGLPGLILELEIISTKNTSNKGFGNVTIKATEVKEVADMKPIEKPKEKNVISEKEYKDLANKEYERYKRMSSQGVDKD